MIRKTFSTVVGCALAVTGLIAAPATLAADKANLEHELMVLDQSWCNAVVKNDATALGVILADDLTDVSVKGKVNNKAQDIASLKTDKATQCDEDMMQVRVYGDTAVVVGRATVKSVTFNGQFRFTDTYIRRDGHWQVVASQSTEIKQ
jgi:ketosteroid isomerase-like protein